MDLQLYVRVLWRFRLLVASGLVLAIALALLAYGDVGFRDGRPQLTPRQSELWASRATLLVTQRGFPLGRSITEVYDFTRDPETGREIAEPRFASGGRFSELAAVYAALATSDDVIGLMLRDGPILGNVQAEAVRTEDRRTLPLIQLTAMASSPDAAVQLAERNVAAFLAYLAQEQTAANIAPRDRVIVSPIGRPQGAALEVPIKLTRPIVVLMTVMIAILGLAFLLHNLRPQAMRPGAAEPQDGLEQLERRQTA